MIIRKFKKNDTSKVASLAYRTYKKYNASDYFDKKGVQKMLDFFDLKKNPDLYERFRKNPIFFVAEEKGRIIGFVRGKPEKLVSLFVEGAFHKKGIGRKLVEKFENVAKIMGAKKIKLNASLYATKFYQKMGYKKSTGLRNFHGIKIFPMKKMLK